MSSQLIRRWVLGLTAGFLFVQLGCSLSESTEPEQSAPALKQVAVYELSIPEPSGLTLQSDGQSLWTVSDQTNQVYRINLTGTVLQTLKYQGEDLEGIAYDSTEHCLWVAEEVSRELVKLDLQGNELERHKLLSGSDNSGLEGVCIDGNHRFFALKEKRPGLFLVLNTDFTVQQKIELQFAGDYSGLWADTVSGRFWIVSDESQMLFLWDISQGVLQQYSLPITKAEGIAVDTQKGLFYLVSDAESRLYVLSKQ